MAAGELRFEASLPKRWWRRVMEFSGDVLLGFLKVTIGGGSEPAGAFFGSGMVFA